MKKQEIEKLQEKYGVKKLQELINTGVAWRLEGAVGREAMAALKEGSCTLPENAQTDYWGNRVPSLNEVKPGTTGSFQNAQDFWSNIGESSELHQSH